MFFNTTGTDNNAVGVNALRDNDSGFVNNAVGSSALFSNVAGIANVAIGDSALNNSDSNFNTAVGFNAGQSVIAGTENIYLGDSAAHGIDVVDISSTTPRFVRTIDVAGWKRAGDATSAPPTGAAWTPVQTVPDAAAYAPITILIDERDDGVHLSYDAMASFLAPYGSPTALAVARALDEEHRATLSVA